MPGNALTLAGWNIYATGPCCLEPAVVRHRFIYPNTFVVVSTTCAVMKWRVYHPKLLRFWSDWCPHMEVMRGSGSFFWGVIGLFFDWFRRKGRVSAPLSTYISKDGHRWPIAPHAADMGRWNNGVHASKDFPAPPAWLKTLQITKDPPCWFPPSSSPLLAGSSFKFPSHPMKTTDKRSY